MAAYESKVDPHEFDGKRVLVTGGTKGIGQAVVARLRDGGAMVLTTARGRPSDLADTDLFVAADITTAEGCTVVADAVLKRLGDRHHCPCRGRLVSTCRWLRGA